MSDPMKETHGFEFVKRESVPEISSEIFVYHHKQTGARFIHVKNEDDNKVFSVGFRTPPADHTGVPHIMEHSVLCGSEKYPTKDPFIELNKSSLKTFLNAMTYPDKTVYPVASRNKKDFFNLMDVYCDAVFHPLIYKNKNIFLQEGWHYELKDKDSPLRCNGVVYSEMKGDFSSPDSYFFRKILNSLFPDTPYGFVSGGDPEFIPELSYEAFLDFHRTFYHPSNSYLYLYGDAKTEEVLEFLHNRYLKEYSKIECPSVIKKQTPFDSLRTESYRYPVSGGEETEGKTYLAWSVAAGDALDPETVLGMDILKYILLDTPASPLRRSLMEKKIGKSVYGMYLSGIRQPLLTVMVKGSEAEKKDEFLQTVSQTLMQCAEEGLDPSLVEGAVNRKEFELREGDFQGFPRGLVYNIAAFQGWLFDGDPSLHLAFEKPLASIKQKAQNKYFEELIKTFILDNSHATVITMSPQPGKIEEMETELAEKLKRKKETMAPEEISQIIEEQRWLREWQNTPDTPEAAASLPRLEISDIKPEAEEFSAARYDIGDSLLLHSTAETNGITYDHIFFPLTELRREEWASAALLAEILGGMDTENYDYQSLSKAMDKLFGDFNTDITVYANPKKNPEAINAGIVVQARFLNEKSDAVASLMKEILYKTDFGNKERLHEILQNVRARLESQAMQAGHVLAMKRLSASLSAEGNFSEAVSGLEYYRFIKQTVDNFDDDFEKIKSSLEKAARTVFAESCPLFSVTTNGLIPIDVLKERLLSLIPPGPFPEKEKTLVLKPQKHLNEGITIPGQVQYVAQGYNYHQLGYRYKGTLLVMATILKYDYLWNQIRVQGGAYGVFPRLTRSGLMIFCSYRDPQLKKTLDVYRRIPDFISSLDLGPEEILKYIIGTVSELDKPVTPAMKGDIILSRELQGLSQDDFQQERREVLQVTEEEIRELSGLLRDVLSKQVFCVIGSESEIRKEESLFQSVIGFYE